MIKRTFVSRDIVLKRMNAPSTKSLWATSL